MTTIQPSPPNGLHKRLITVIMDYYFYLHLALLTMKIVHHQLKRKHSTGSISYHTTDYASVSASLNYIITVLSL